MMMEIPMKVCKKLRNLRRNAMKPWQNDGGILKFLFYTETLIVVELFLYSLYIFGQAKGVDDDDD